MKILWHSAAPWVSTGYGRVTREIATRIHNTDQHEVAVQCLSSVRQDKQRWYGDVWDGQEWKTPVEPDEPIEVYPSSSNARQTHFGMEEAPSHFEDSDSDFYFTHFDTWKDYPRELIPEMGVPYSSYVIVDHHPAPNAVVSQVSNAQEVVCMSKFSKMALEQKGIRPTYIPHGVDTDKYHPIDKGKENYPSTLVIEDDEGESKRVDLEKRTVFGILAANFGDRKNIPGMMIAFSKFLEKIDDEAILYLHTRQNSPHGYNLREVQNEIGIPDENIVWQLSEDYHSLQDKELNKYYNAFDVLINCSMGESWGLAVTEAQAAGVPCIVTNFSAMPEQVGIGPDHNKWHETVPESYKSDNSFVVGEHGIAVNPVVGLFRERVSSKQYLTHPQDIFRAMKYYYDNPSIRNAHGELAREFVEERYSLKDSVVPRFKSFFDRMEQQIAHKE